MSDFALWVWGAAVGRSLGESPGQFLATYARNQAKGSEIALESSPVAVGVLTSMANRPVWAGTAQSLLDLFADLVQPSARPRNWPASHRALSGALSRLAPALRAAGVSVERGFASDHMKSRIITLPKDCSPVMAESNA